MSCNEIRLFDHNIIKMGNAVRLKWERIAQGKQEDRGRFDCVYCLNFYNFEDFRIRCSGCPIKYFTKHTECVRTPYPDFHWATANLKNDSDGVAITTKRMKAFVDEIFIRSLLLIDWRKYYEMPSLQKQED